MTLDRDVVYLGGHFDSATDPAGGTLERRRLAAIDLSSGSYLSWAPRANSIHGVFALADTPGYLAAGGEFSKINNKLQQGFAQFMLPTG